MNHMTATEFSESELIAGTFIFNSQPKTLNESSVWVISYRDGDVLFLCDALSAKLIYTKNTSENVIRHILENHLSIGRLNLVPPDKMFGKSTSVYNSRKDFIAKVLSHFGPSLEPFTCKQPRWSEFCRLNGYERKNAMTILLRWLQLGRSDYALCDARLTAGKKKKKYAYSERAGMKYSDGTNDGVIMTDEVKRVFAKYLPMVKSRRYRKVSLVGIYHIMIASTDWKNAQTPNDRPSLRQWYYYVSTHLSAEERIRGTNGDLDFDNNFRPAPGDSVHDAIGVMDLCEIDETEIDAYVVDVDENGKRRVVGRPIVYTMLDVYSRMIVAFSCAFDNNSVEGAIALLANLATHKFQFVGEVTGGRLELDSEAWPDAGKPHRLRSDHGAEYVSHGFEEILDRLGINLELVPVASGRSKGAEERAFRSLMDTQLALLEHNGRVTHQYDSDHIQRACLTLEDYKKLVLNSVIAHNVRHNTKYPASPDQQSSLPDFSPAALWKYSVERYGVPEPISNQSDFIYSLLFDITSYATISRRGIHVKIGDGELVYWDNENHDLAELSIRAGDTKVPFQCRIDKRSLKTIYYRNDAGNIVAVPLYEKSNLNRGADKLTWTQFAELTKKDPEKIRMQKFKTAQIGATAQSENMKVIANAIKNSGDSSPDRKNVRANRHDAKNRQHISNPLMNAVTDDTLINNEAGETVADVNAIDNVNNAENASEKYETTEDFFAALDAIEEE